MLQHIEPRYSGACLREFARLLAPGGYLSFDLPSASGDAAAGADGSVPASAMRARLTVTPHGPLVVGEGASLRFTVAVRDLSEAVWRDAPGRELNVGVTDDLPAGAVTARDGAAPEDAAHAEAATGDAGLDPVMEMHAVPRDEVEAVPSDAGARLIDVRRVHHCGPAAASRSLHGERA